jgi:cholesterol transport system auxiliary component
MATVAVVAMAAGLAGCISLFPKVPPSQFYTFGGSFSPRQGGEADGPRVNVLRTPTSFAQAAANDRILTTNGDEEAYIAASRWISPAAVLFDEAETRAFDADAGVARLIRPGEAASATVALRLEVPTFEVRYPGDLKATPSVVISVRAVLTSMNDRHIIAEKDFAYQQTVAANRVSEIVRGFDAGAVDVLSQVAAWTDQQAGGTIAPTS